MSDYKDHYENSYELVIGIDDFRAAPPLDTALYGAEAVATLLEQHYRFDQVITMHDDQATRSNIEDAYTDLRNTMSEDDRFVNECVPGAAVFGDKGYNSAPDAQTMLEDTGVRLVPIRCKNMEPNTWTGDFDLRLYRKRIETIYSNLIPWEFKGYTPAPILVLN